MNLRNGKTRFYVGCRACLWRGYRTRRVMNLLRCPDCGERGQMVELVYDPAASRYHFPKKEETK